MSKSLLIGMATATLVASTVVGAGVANAWQVKSAPQATIAVEKVGYHGHGYWRPYMGIGPAFGVGCPMRKVWVDTPWGPRLKWRRVCRPYF